MKKNNIVFNISLLLTSVVVILGLVSPTMFKNVSNKGFNIVVNNFNWVYLIVMLALVIFAGFLIFSKYGNIRLGKDTDRPEFSNLSWFSMLFGAGMGIGLVFFGAVEPMKHFVNPIGAESGSLAAKNFAMQQSFIHWGVTPWAAYAIMGLSLAYFQFRKDAPGLISSVFLPILGEEGVKGPIGKTIDILAVFTTVTGIATSLGMGTMQIAGGLEYMFGIKNTIYLQIVIIAIATVLYIKSSTSGLDKGIKLLSNINLALAALLLFGAAIIGPTTHMISNFSNGMGLYVEQFISQSLYMDPTGEWIAQWRVFYWAMWIAWIPFVGIFIARISKGRTIREFIIGVTLVPALACIVWFSVFGTLGTNLGLDFAKDATMVTETALFKVFSNYQFGNILSLVAMVLLCTFFISSADSATYVLGMFTSNGDLNPSNKKKITWGIIQALLALALLMSGGLETLQTVSIVSAFPFAIIMIVSIVSITKALKTEFKVENEVKKEFVSKKEYNKPVVKIKKEAY
ncbi:transporter, betaine/carnitine/choline transporter family protein [[Clostridium] bifermentans ATCC 638]|uniref:Transporter, betaine/carnitine/choline transporter family protein n=1 Tax=Paraclostridium bifermentans ATCC 638 = DSM 14991 TaxID=1233171 RepID=T4VLF8_PARBF|nr:BCCT family transporter [Paraclostridium bifermentans]EQK42328.1 transporter, betaine/carnitine/choline transporter family protein [[Clostridium] bifermentans ATCC 638] [Paraclostridium bifermentans ATCC 638 = DSM 14991]UAG19179.1 BCCT family transporter [Paraclostridium bifermentans]